MDKEVVYIIYAMEYYSAITKNEIMPFAATWLNLEITILNEVSQIGERQILYDITYIWNLKYNTNEHTYETETHSQTYRTYWSLPRGRETGGEIDWEFGISRCKLLYIEWINNNVLLYSTGNYIQYPVINHSGKEYEKGCIYMYN